MYVFAVLLITNCSSTRMVDSWKSQEYNNYKPKKVLIVGVTENLTARKKFETHLKSELVNRGIDAVESYDVFEPTFTSLKQTEEDIQKEVEKISKDGFDAILISAVKGIDEKTTYTGDWYIADYHWRRFGRYYYLYQDVYFDRGYYNKYKIYNMESSLYNLKENDDKYLVWVASYNVVDPTTIDATVNDYVKAIIKSLEKESLITRINY
jgi:predicted Zn-dependent peptidase